MGTVNNTALDSGPAGERLGSQIARPRFPSAFRILGTLVLFLYKVTAHKLGIGSSGIGCAGDRGFRTKSAVGRSEIALAQRPNDPAV